MRVRGSVPVLCTGRRLSRAQSGASAPDGVTRLVAAIDAAARPATARHCARWRGPRRRRADHRFRHQPDSPPVSSAAPVKERDRGGASPRRRQRLMLESADGPRGEGRVTTWRIDARPPGAGRHMADRRRRAADRRQRPVPSGARHDHRVQASTTWCSGRRISTLSIPAGQAFVARTHEGPTAIVVHRPRPRSTSRRRPHRNAASCGFSPAPRSSRRTSTRCSSGSTPAIWPRTSTTRSLRRAPVDAAQLRRASQMFESYISRSFAIDLNDLSVARWSLVPSPDDFVAEMRTHRYGPLTYTRATGGARGHFVFRQAAAATISASTRRPTRWRRAAGSSAKTIARIPTTLPATTSRLVRPRTFVDRGRGEAGGPHPCQCGSRR